MSASRSSIRRPTPSRRSPALAKGAPRTAPSSRSREPVAEKLGGAEREDLLRRAAALLGTEIFFVSHPSFVGRRDTGDSADSLAARVELGEPLPPPRGSSLPTHLAALCATPLLSPEDEAEMFRRMNYCKHRANALRARLSRTRPDADKVRLAEQLLLRANCLRNHLLQANTRLVMSIARRFADARNSFDDLLSQGVTSLMHAVEKFDYGRGYRFSTYATCAVRRDLYRLVMMRKRDLQRYATGSCEFLSECSAADETPTLGETAWPELSRSVQEMLSELDDRERRIVAARFGLDGSAKKASYSRLGAQLGISKERVRQLANRGLEKLRESAAERRLDTLLA